MSPPEPGAQLHLVVWKPMGRHPMTGRSQLLISNYSDRIITYRERDELEAHYMMPSAPSSMSLRRD